MKTTLKVLTLLQVLQLALGAVNISAVEQQLKKSSMDFHAKEKKITQSIYSCDSYLTVASANLKASNIASNLTKIIDDGRKVLSDLKFFKYVDGFESYSSLPACEYVSIRQSTVDLEYQNFDAVSSDHVAKLTKLLLLRKKITASYVKNFKVFLNFRSKELSVIYAIRELGKAASEFIGYLQMLSAGKKNWNQMRTYLNNSMASMNCTLKDSKFQVRGQQLDADLGYLEKILQVSQAEAINKIQEVLKTVKATEGDQSDLKTNLKGLMDTLTETSSVSHFTNVSWPRLPDNPGKAIAFKLRSSKEKRGHYFSIKEEASKNQSRIANNRRSVDEQSKVSSSRKVSASEAIAGILNATIEAEKKFGDMAKQLSATIDEMNKDIAEYEQLITTTTMKPTSTYRTVVTSSTLAPTTTRIPPCGTFVPFDTVNGLNDLKTKGVSAGTFSDGSIAYVGHGDNSGCFGQNPSPGRICDVPGKAGGYFGCTGINYKPTGNSYLINHPNLMWVPTNSTHMMTVPSALKVMGGNFPFFYGRTIQGNATFLGKLAAGNGFFALYYTDAIVEYVITTGYEMLTCGGPATTTTTITTTTTLPPCGTFAPYDTVNGVSALKNFGFPAGAYYGGLIYVGYGNNQDCNLNQCPGMLTDYVVNPGGFYNCAVVKYRAAGNFYLLNHPNLRWVKTDTTGMKTVPKALLVMSGTEKFFFARFVNSNNNTFLGKASDRWTSFHYIDVEKEVRQDTGIEIVTCV